MSVIEKHDRRDTYTRVTDRIIAMLEEGVVAWHKPWAGGGMPTSLSTKKHYRGINTFLLAMEGYASPWWGTYRQITELGGQVRKGEHSTEVVFWKRLEVNTTAEERAAGKGDKKRVLLLRQFRVFNAEQADGLDAKYLAPEFVGDELDAIAAAEEIMEGYKDGPPITYKGTAAFYRPGQDTITLPPRKRFETADEFYSTAFHEMTHSTGHPSRLNRDTVTQSARFGSATYSKEELVAEMGAAFLAGVAGIELVTIPNSAAYLGHWLGVLKGDSKLVVQAAGQAQRAADHILGTTFEPDTTNEGEN